MGNDQGLTSASLSFNCVSHLNSKPEAGLGSASSEEILPAYSYSTVKNCYSHFSLYYSFDFDVSQIFPVNFTRKISQEIHEIGRQLVKCEISDFKNIPSQPQLVAPFICVCMCVFENRLEITLTKQDLLLLIFRNMSDKITTKARLK